MASGSSSSQGNCSRAPAGAPLTDAGHLSGQPSINAEFVAMPATELIAHLDRYRCAADFADAAVVLADRERRLAQLEALVSAGDKRVERLQERISARDALIRQAAETEANLRAEIRALQQAGVANAEAGAQQQPRAADARAHARHGSRGVRDNASVGMMPARGEAGGNVRPTRYRALRMRAQSPEFHDDKSMSLDTGVQTRLTEGKQVGDNAHKMRGNKSLRMNASPPGFQGCAVQAKQRRRKS